MNDTAVHARYRIEAMGGIDRAELVFLDRFLRRALHNRGGDYVTPLDLVSQRLRFEQCQLAARATGRPKTPLSSNIVVLTATERTQRGQ